MILVGHATREGIVVAFCIADHHWQAGVRREVLRLMHEHVLRAHPGQAFKVVEPPTFSPAYRPEPIDRVGA